MDPGAACNWLRLLKLQQLCTDCAIDGLLLVADADVDEQPEGLEAIRWLSGSTALMPNVIVVSPSCVAILFAPHARGEVAAIAASSLVPGLDLYLSNEEPERNRLLVQNMLSGVARVGAPFSLDPVASSTPPPQSSARLTAWLQARGCAGVAVATAVGAQLHAIMSEADAAALHAALWGSAARLHERWDGVTTAMDSRPSALNARIHAELTERVASASLSPGVSRVIFGGRTGRGATYGRSTEATLGSSRWAQEEPSLPDAPALHYVIEAVEGPLRVARTLPVGTGGEPTGSDAALLMGLYACLGEAVTAAITACCSGRDVRVAAEAALVTAATARGLPVPFPIHCHLDLAMWACERSEAASYAPRGGDGRFKVVRAVLSGIVSQEHPGRCLGAVMHADTFVDASSEPGGFLVLTAGCGQPAAERAAWLESAKAAVVGIAARALAVAVAGTVAGSSAAQALPKPSTAAVPVILLCSVFACKMLRAASCALARMPGGDSFVFVRSSFAEGDTSALTTAVASARLRGSRSCVVVLAQGYGAAAHRDAILCSPALSSGDAILGHVVALIAPGACEAQLPGPGVLSLLQPGATTAVAAFGGRGDAAVDAALDFALRRLPTALLLRASDGLEALLTVPTATGDEARLGVTEAVAVAAAQAASGSLVVVVAEAGGVVELPRLRSALEILFASHPVLRWAVGAMQCGDGNGQTYRVETQGHHFGDSAVRITPDVVAAGRAGLCITFGIGGAGRRRIAVEDAIKAELEKCGRHGGVPPPLPARRVACDVPAAEMAAVRDSLELSPPPPAGYFHDGAGYADFASCTRVPERPDWNDVFERWLDQEHAAVCAAAAVAPPAVLLDVTVTCTLD